MSFTVTEIDSFKSSTITQASYTSPTFSPAAGDVVVVVAATNLNQLPSSIVDSLSNTYTTAAEGTGGSTVGGSMRFFKYTGAQSNITVTVNWSPSVSERLVKVLKIVGGGTPPDTASAGGTSGNAQIKATSTTGTGAAPGSMTPTNVDLIIAAAHWSNATAISSGPSGYTNTGSDLLEATRGRGLSTYYKAQSGTGAENPSWTLGSGSAWVAIQLGIPTGAVTTLQTLSASAVSSATAPKVVTKILAA